tara:strand:+ start:6567 stop:7277 length:711 start_codon:yes stop_codon:yes gene_type:complete
MNLLKDKKVIIVGPANNLIGEKKGKFIDSFDIVCRLNDSYIISEDRIEDYGKRCDILLHTCNCEMLCIMNRYRKYLKECKLVINPTSSVHGQDYNNTKKNVYENYLDINLNIPFYQVKGKFEKNMLKSNLNTGMCALDFLLNGTELKSLHICGFSFHGIKEKKYIRGNTVLSYETYLFDSKIVYNCNCDSTKPCKKRNDPRYANCSNEKYQLDYFKNNIMNHSKAIIDDTIKNLLS